MVSHIAVTVVLGTLLACSPSTERPPREPGNPEGCVAAAGTAQGAIEAPDVPTSAILRPNDVACFTLDAANNVHSVPRAAAGTPHISAHMTAEPGMTMLFVQNGTSSKLAYRALIRPSGAPEWKETSIVPVLPGLLGAESWPQPVDAIALFDLRPVPAR